MNAEQSKLSIDIENRNRTEMQINSFDEYNPDYWQFEDSENNNPEYGFINPIQSNDIVLEGEGALKFEYSIHNIEPWGGYVKYYHMHPDLDNGGVYDWTGYNTLSISYFIETAASTPGQTHFRLNISDYANIQDPSYTGLGEYYYSFQYILDNEPGWNTLDIPLMRTDDWSGYGFNLTGWAGEAENGVLDLHAIGGFHFEFSIGGAGEGNYSSGSIIFDDFKLKLVNDDVTPPDPPENITIVDGDYLNIIMWEDVQNESGETYKVYASLDPNDFFGESAMLVSELGEDVQVAYHLLTVPLNDTDLSYYYGIQCIDSWGNSSEVEITENSFTNLARGIPIISTSNVPENILIDGSLDEWELSNIVPFFLGPLDNSWGTPNIPIGSIDSNDDLSATVYLAIDETYIYIAGSVQDDSYNGHNDEWDWWEYDAVELFLGLYDSPIEPHLSFQRGSEPDYQFIFLPNSLQEGQNGLYLASGSENYNHIVDGNSYSFEAVLSLSDIAGDYDDVYQFFEGDRIPIEINIHDNDGNGREALLTGSHLNMDNAWQNPSVWTSTFIYPSEVLMPLSLYTSEEFVLPGDTVIVQVSIDNMTVPVSSFEMAISGFEDKLDIDTSYFGSESIIDYNNWIMETNVIGNSLIIAAAGSQDFEGSGILFEMKFYAHDTLSAQIIDLTLQQFLGNENLSEYEYFSGGVNIIHEPQALFSSDLTSGNYPLTVNFSNNSIAGSFPIINFSWDLGNGELSTEESPITAYTLPGFYDVSLSIEDSFGLRDTLIIPNFISVDTLYGDVDFSSDVTVDDAIAILENCVGLSNLDSLAYNVADVTQNDIVSNLDASLVLQYSNGSIENLPIIDNNEYLANGEITLEDQNANPGTIITVPILIMNPDNIYGFTGELHFDPNVLNIESVVLNDINQEGIIVYDEIIPGQLRFSGSLQNPLTEDLSILNLEFFVGENFTEETNISLTDLRWNEGDVSDTPIEMTISFGLGVEVASIPELFALHQNYPNPFNPTTQIQYDLPEEQNVTIAIYDVTGRSIRTLMNLKQKAGYHSIQWDAKNDIGEIVAGGMYIYTIQAGDFRATKKNGAFKINSSNND